MIFLVMILFSFLIFQSYEESIGQEKSHVTFRTNKFEETSCGFAGQELEFLQQQQQQQQQQMCKENGDVHVTTQAVVVVNHLVSTFRTY